MREASSQTRALVADGTPARVWVADLMYDGERRIPGVPISNPDLAWDAGAFVVGSGNVRIVWSDDHGTSMIPKQIGDWFSPFGAELQIDCIVGVGVFAERVPQGRFLIESVPETTGAGLPFQGRTINVGESFKVNLKDQLLRVQRDDFPVPSGSQSTSAWQEIQSVTGLPVIRNLPDATIPLTAYADGRDAVLSKLFDALGAWPHPHPSGALTARPKAWPDPVDEVRGVVSAPLTLASDKTYNRVVVEGKAPSGEPIYALQEITEGFLRARNGDGSVSPFGGATYRYQSDFLTTFEQCDAYARALLPRVSRIRGVTRDITEPFNPLREVGDVLKFGDGVVRVKQLSHPGATTHMVVEVPDA